MSVSEHQLPVDWEHKLPVDWDTCPIEEKIERLRQAVRDLRCRINELRRRTISFEHHAHDAKGEIVVPLKYHHHQVGEGMTRDLLV